MRANPFAALSPIEVPRGQCLSERREGRSVEASRSSSPHPNPLPQAGEGMGGGIVRILVLGLVVNWLAITTAQAEPTIRVGSLRYGTLSWELDVIAHCGLSEKYGVRMETL